MKSEVEKVKALRTATGPDGTGTNVAARRRDTLRPEDVVRIMDEEVQRRWRESRLAEIKALELMEQRRKEFHKKLAKDARPATSNPPLPRECCGIRSPRTQWC